MACKFDEKIIHLYTDNELGETARARVAEHLKNCDHCRALEQAIREQKSNLYEACSAVKAPSHLRNRILAGLDSEAKPEPVMLSFFERLRLTLDGFKTSRVTALGAVFAVVMLLVMFPGEEGLSSMAGDLAREHMELPDLDASGFLATANANEVEEYFFNELKLETDIPPFLEGGFTLTGAEIVESDDLPLAHARYSDGKIKCSLFIFVDPRTSFDASKTVIAAGKEFEISSSSDVNFICWHDNKTAYILCGCCCFDKLTSLALAGI